MPNVGERTSTQKLIAELYSAKWGREVDIKEVLVTLYSTNRMPIYKIAKELHVGVGTVHKWLRELGITTRKIQWM
jgi:transposase-like protein